MLKATIHRFEWPGPKELACALCLLLALGALGIWANLVGYGTAFILPAETSPAFEATRYAFHGGRALAALLLLLFPKTVDRASVAASAIIPIFMSFCTVGFSIAPFQTLLSTYTVSIVASLVLGFAYIWVIVALYVSIARCLPAGLCGCPPEIPSFPSGGPCCRSDNRAGRQHGDQLRKPSSHTAVSLLHMSGSLDDRADDDASP